MNDEAIDLLIEVQWSSVNDCNESCCPVCGAVSYSEGTGTHWRGCKLAALVGAECSLMTSEESEAQKALAKRDAKIAAAEAEVARLKAERKC